MAQINRYRIRPGFHMPNHVLKGGKWIRKDANWFLGKSFVAKDLPDKLNFSINIAFVNEDLSEWNDFDSVLVLDDDYAQPYTPFYGENYGQEIHDFPILEKVIDRYNQFMDHQFYLERI